MYDLLEQFGPQLKLSQFSIDGLIKTLLRNFGKLKFVFAGSVVSVT